MYEVACPGVARQNLEYDSASISLDPQDRTLAAPFMKLPRLFGELPKPKLLYHSKLKALNVPKRQHTLQETLSAVAARNLNAPVVCLPDDDDARIEDIWRNFLELAAVPEAAAKLREYRSDPVGIEEEAFREWAAQSSPAKVAEVERELAEFQRAIEQENVGDYMLMLKSDVKPTLSVKPIDTRTEPQVIVYHRKTLSALFSCMFRVLVRRFLALLDPRFHVNLTKDVRDIEKFLNTTHPFGTVPLTYLENDFSKYDKSQGRFAFKLEEFVFRQLGLDENMLQHWVQGHVECKISSLALGMSLHVMYQRKSGDATTAFGNVMINVLSVLYAYKPRKLLWGLFMGDDSLIAMLDPHPQPAAVQVLAEVFNLSAKTFVTTAPYFASNFVLIDNVNEQVAVVPDPVKRVERWSMAISGEEPMWEERYTSACDALGNYRSCLRTAGLARAVAERYAIPFETVAGVSSAISTLLTSPGKFRAIWEDTLRVSIY